MALRLALKRADRERFFAAFDDEEAFRARAAAMQKRGRDKESNTRR